MQKFCSTIINDTTSVDQQSPWEPSASFRNNPRMSGTGLVASRLLLSQSLKQSDRVYDINLTLLFGVAMRQLIRGFNILFYLTWIITQPIIHMSPSLIIICEHPNYPEVNTNNSAFCVNLFQKRDFIYLLLYVSVIFINVVCLSIFVAILIYRKHPH